MCVLGIYRARVLQYWVQPIVYCCIGLLGASGRTTICTTALYLDNSSCYRCVLEPVSIELLSTECLSPTVTYLALTELPLDSRRQTQQTLSGAKARLEGSMLEGSTSDVVKGVTYIQVQERELTFPLAVASRMGCNVYRLITCLSCQGKGHDGS